MTYRCQKARFEPKDKGHQHSILHNQDVLRDQTECRWNKSYLSWCPDKLYAAEHHTSSTWAKEKKVSIQLNDVDLVVVIIQMVWCLGRQDFKFIFCFDPNCKNKMSSFFIPFPLLCAGCFSADACRRSSNTSQILTNQPTNT